MTGSIIFNRQHSSTAACVKQDKMKRPKLRRCSSANDQDVIELSVNDNQYKGTVSTKCYQTSNESDSGVEDVDQSPNNFTCAQSHNTDEEESSTCFGGCEDENIEENPINRQSEYYEQCTSCDDHDTRLAANVPDDEKKLFCANTIEVFHGEFAHLIAVPIGSKFKVKYFLFSKEEVTTGLCIWDEQAFIKLDNAKAQFKCPNNRCRRLWTSMRARISFWVSRPQTYSLVILKIYGQNCQACKTLADPLWYPEEVCRVMKNLAKSILCRYFSPSAIVDDILKDKNMVDATNKISRRSRHDPDQREGKMNAPHDRYLCEACRFGLCFA